MRQDDEDDFDVQNEEDDDLPTLEGEVAGTESGSSSFNHLTRNRSQSLVQCKSIRRINEDGEAEPLCDSTSKLSLNASSRSNSCTRNPDEDSRVGVVDQQKRKLMEGLNLQLRQRLLQQQNNQNYNQDEERSREEKNRQEIEYHAQRRDSASSSDQSNLLLHHRLRNASSGLLLLESSGMTEILCLQEELLAKQRLILLKKQEYHDNNHLQSKARSEDEDLEAEKRIQNNMSTVAVAPKTESNQNEETASSESKGSKSEQLEIKHSLIDGKTRESILFQVCRSTPVKGVKPDKLPPKPMIVPTQQSSVSSPFMSPLNQTRIKMGINSQTAKNGLSIKSPAKQLGNTSNPGHLIKSSNNSSDSSSDCLDKQVTEGVQDHTRVRHVNQTIMIAEKNNNLNNSRRPEEEPSGVNCRPKPVVQHFLNNSSIVRPSSSNSTSSIKKLSRPKEQPPPP